MLSSYFAPTSVVPASQAVSAVPLAAIRQIVQEVADARANNLAFRQAIAEHEAANVPSATAAQPPARRLRGRAGGGGGGGGAASMQPANKADLRVRPPSGKIPSGVPKSLQTRSSGIPSSLTST